MTIKIKTSSKSNKNTILENSNFLNNQNYIIAENEKKKILIKFFINLTNKNISIFFKKVNNFFLKIPKWMFNFFIFLFLVSLFVIPITIITLFTFEGIYLVGKTFDILIITFLLTPFLIYIGITIYRLFFKYNILFKIFFPIFFMVNIFNFLYTFIFVFFFKMKNKYLILKKKTETKVLEEFNLIDKNYAENDFYKIIIKK